MTEQGESGPGAQPPDDETRSDWPPPAGPPPATTPPAGPPSATQPPAGPPSATPPPAGPPSATPPPAGPPPASAPPTAPASAPASWAAPYTPGYDAATGGAGWAAPPVGGRYAVPGAPGLEFAGALPRFVAYFIDGFLLGIVSGIITSTLFALAPGTGAASVSSSVIGVAINAVYFVGLWTSGDKATLGMRLLKLQVGNAFDGRQIDANQAIRRWLALGSWLPAVAFNPALAGLAGLVGFLWVIVLLVTTVSSPTKQGIHDRIANTAVVQPVGGSGNALLVGCVVVIGIVAVIALLSIIALIFLGSQVSSILSTVGESV
jgi:uncharacterized RDD family membrane protein YckC